MTTPQFREIRALYSTSTIRVYQAFNHAIADVAVQNNNFSSVPGFKVDRATWIKPSFCWMAYRSDYAQKDRNQERILAIDLSIEGFEKILSKATVVCKGSDAKLSEVVVQWDPERDVALNKLDYRSIQIGLKGSMARKYAQGDFIVQITDVTEEFTAIKTLLDQGSRDLAEQRLPTERVYPLTPELEKILQTSKTDST
jgi:hypothetical protein